MEFLTTIFHTVFYQPILNVLVALYLFLPIRDLGIAIIFLTILVRIAFYPLTRSAMRSQGALQEIQPKIQELRQQHKDDPQTAGRAMMALYREHGINPFGSILPVLVQLPILFALFRVFLSGLTASPEALATDLYAFLPHPGALSPHSLMGAVDLTARSPILAGFAGIAQFVQSSLAFRPLRNTSAKKGDMTTMLSWQMRYLFPVMTVLFAASLPAGIALYWVVTTVFSVGQQLVFNRERAKRAA
ncbi:MAG: membrane protein insertase YidC [Candidatus Terrybacteria bacterium]|nr:membrane protein insertase YidC [Candidatus Terrybacteria bacterium]